MIRNRQWGGLILTVLGLTGLSACGGGTATGPREITVQATEFAFTPKALSMSSQETVRLIFENKGTVLHDFVVADLEAEVIEQEGGSPHHTPGMDTPIAYKQHGGPPVIHLAVEPGEMATITFIPHEVGEYEFYCSVPGHKEAGMSGTLTVTP